jgi:NAD(P)-dependent dehydrogenase (short-subunit alcohol dehydrogenase family)
MTQKAQINPSSVFVVSGGAKGITAQCTLRLAQQYQCKWILLGRSELAGVEPTWAEDCFSESELKKLIMQDFLAKGDKPTPMKIQGVFKQISSSREIQKTISSLEQLGSQVEYLSVDVTDAIALEKKLTAAVERMGAITGIIHGAGNLADKWIENKTEEDFENVYAAKVKGLENLLRCAPASQLDYLVLFSSVAGFFGSAGQSDYALANEILNKSAHLVKQDHPSCHVVTINWGPWDSGMVTPELKKAFAQRNIEIIPIEVGTQMLADELSATHKETAQVVIGSALTPPAEELDSELRTYRIRRRLTLEANPFLQAHVIGGNPVLPATCAVGWTIDSCQQFYPGYQFASLQNFQVLKGIVFDGTQADLFFVDVKEIAKDNTNGEIDFEVRIWSEKEKGKLRFHYNAQLKLKQQLLPRPKHNLNLATPQKILDGALFYQNKTLFHGSLLEGIKRVVQINPETLILECFLPKIEEQQQGQFLVKTFNPYTADLLLQGILIWLGIFEGKGALPAEIRQIDEFQAFPFDRDIQAELKIILKTDTNLTVNITAFDETGQVYLSLAGVTVTISKALNHLFANSIR